MVTTSILSLICMLLPVLEINMFVSSKNEEMNWKLNNVSTVLTEVVSKINDTKEQNDFHQTVFNKENADENDILSNNDYYGKLDRNDTLMRLQNIVPNINYKNRGIESSNYFTRYQVTPISPVKINNFKEVSSISDTEQNVHQERHYPHSNYPNTLIHHYKANNSRKLPLYLRPSLRDLQLYSNHEHDARYSSFPNTPAVSAQKHLVQKFTSLAREEMQMALDLNVEQYRGGRFSIPGENGNKEPTIPPNTCGLCPLFGLKPCVCTSNGGSLGGTISIDCPAEMSSQDQMREIIQHTTFITTNVSRFSLVGSNISGVFDLHTLLHPLTVRVLLLNDDHFQSVDNHAFNSSVEGLTLISLENNDISYFHFASVNDLTQLRSLNLAGNLLQFIPKESFVRPSLRFLDLSRNQIYTLSYNAFEGLRNIEIIDVSHNKLTDLQDNTFRIPDHNMDKVLELDLSFNSITYIMPLAFANLKYLHVNLASNKLTTLNEAVFRSIIVDSGYFAYFVMQGNPIVCDCGIYWVVENSLFTNCYDDFQCSDRPETLYQLTMDDLSDCR